MKIHLGVADQLYSGKNISTGDVAEILEAKYGILKEFFVAHQSDIQLLIERCYLKAFEEMAAGLPSRDPFGSAMQEIQQMMDDWLSKQEVEKVGIKGVPTKAALLGKNSNFASGFNQVSMKKFKKGVRVGKRRPSFVNSGLMRASYRAWVEK